MSQRKIKVEVTQKMRNRLQYLNSVSRKKKGEKQIKWIEKYFSKIQKMSQTEISVQKFMKFRPKGFTINDI